MILLLFLISFWHGTHSENTPFNPCPEYFQYIKDDNHAFGKITLQNIQNGSLTLNITFCQRELLQSKSTGQILPHYDSIDAINGNLKNIKPYEYRIVFPSANVYPKLVKISVNNEVICAGNSCRAPSCTFSLSHTIFSIKRTNKNKRDTVKIDDFPSDPFLTPTVSVRPRPPPPLPGKPSPTFNIDTRFDTTPVQTTTSSSRCGQEGGGGQSTPFIFGGFVVNRGQYPWLTAVYKKGKYVCGGSLISARTVISAAHCFLAPTVFSDIVVQLGRYNLSDANEVGAIRRNLEGFLIHPQVNLAALADADIALLFLETPISFTANIHPICLWSGSNDVSKIVGPNGYVAGWGADENGNMVSPVLKAVITNIVEESTCLRKSGFTQMTSSRTICAGNLDDTGPCKGDSGNALMIARNGVWSIRGIVSNGVTAHGSCNLREYVIYCDLAKHSLWIQQNIR